jgi:uncharacterized protein (TIGR02996 family)
MASSTEKQLLAAVLASPRDDAPRLVYADWLIEKNDPRGEFIARQVRDPDGPEGVSDAQRRAWFPWQAKGMAAWFRRGFVEKIELGQASEIDRLGQILAAHPVDHLSFATAPRAEVLAKLAASPHRAAIRKLTLRMGTLDEELVKAAQKLALDEVTIEDYFDLAAARAIGSWPGLKRLDVNRSHLALPPALAIVRGSALASVRSLSLGKMYEQVKDVSALVAGLIANKKAKLESLVIQWSKLDAKPLKQILERFSVERLVLRHAWITDAKAKMLAARPQLATLKHLVLPNNEIGDAGATMLAGTRFLEKIERIDLTDNAIKQAGKAALRKRFGDRVLV